MTDIPIRDAATIIVVRDPADHPSVLMGQRGRAAVFMPGKYVFPGGAVDDADRHIQLASDLDGLCARRLAGPGAVAPASLAVAAIRELWEETGQILGQKGDWAAPPAPWADFAATGHRPVAAPLRYVFRAITPPGRPRRFDARFFTLDAANLASDPDDFSAASDELSHLHWVPVAEARKLDLPFITTVALAEIAARLPHLDAPDRVPFFQNNDEDIAIANAALDCPR